MCSSSFSRFVEPVVSHFRIGGISLAGVWVSFYFAMVNAISIIFQMLLLILILCHKVSFTTGLIPHLTPDCVRFAQHAPSVIFALQFVNVALSVVTTLLPRSYIHLCKLLLDCSADRQRYRTSPTSGMLSQRLISRNSSMISLLLWAA